MTLSFLDLIAIVGTLIASFFIIVLILNAFDYIGNKKIKADNEAYEQKKKKLRAEITQSLSELIPAINELTEELEHVRADQIHLSDLVAFDHCDYKIAKIAKGYSESHSYDIDDAIDSVSSLTDLVDRARSQIIPSDKVICDKVREENSEENFEKVVIEITSKTDPDAFSSDSILTTINFRLTKKPVGKISYKAMSDAVNEWNSDAMLTVFEYTESESIGSIRFIIDTAPEEGEEIELSVSTSI